MSATRGMIEKAESHACNKDYVSGYLCLWVAFNNLYAWLSGFSGHDGVRLKRVLESRVSDTVVECICSQPFIQHARALNERHPLQATEEHGVLNMDKFFGGQSSHDCVKRVESPFPTETDPPSVKQAFIVAVATDLLYTVRNNLFHAVKNLADEPDTAVVSHAYALLRPIVQELLVAASARDASTTSGG